MAIGEEIERDGLGVLRERGFLLDLLGRGHAAQTVHLVANLGA